MPASALRDFAVMAGRFGLERVGIDRHQAVGIPGSAEAITTEWLTRVLCSGSNGAAVKQYEIVGGSDGTSSRRALRVTYNEAGVAAGLPSSLFVKSAAHLKQRMLVGLTGITEGESVFFNELRRLVELRSPSGYFAQSDRLSGRSMVIMEDLSALGWTFPIPIRDRVTEADALDIVEQLATYHAKFWNASTGSAALAKLPSPLTFQRRLNSAIPYRLMFNLALARSKALFPGRLWGRRDELWPAGMAALAANADGPQTLLHQDTHPGNWLRDPQGRMGLYDWQCVAYGGWALDVAYALCNCLDRDDRRHWERELLQAYLVGLAERGVSPTPTLDDALVNYRRQALHLALFILPANYSLPFVSAVQPEDFTLAIVERGMRAIDDLGSLDAGR